MKDFNLIDHGLIVLLIPTSDAGREWAEDHLPEDRQRWGHESTVVEPRYVADIVHGINDAGLEISGREHVNDCRMCEA